MGYSKLTFPRRRSPVLFIVLLVLSLLPFLALASGEKETGGTNVEDERAAEEPAQGESADTDPAPAVIPVLVSGPDYGEELPFFPANAIEYYRGIYEMVDQGVVVYYTERDIVPLSSWGESSCGSYTLRTFRREPPEEIAEEIAALQSLPPSGTGSFLYHDGGDFHLFFGFIGGDVSCPFVESFIRSYLYFRAVSGGKPGLPQFPAVLNDLR